MHENLTWTCHSCGEERPDAQIDVATFPLKDFPGGEINIRYCNDRIECEQKAWAAGKRGEFPKRTIDDQE